MLLVTQLIVKAATGLPTSVAVTAGADLFFPAEGSTSALGNILGGTPLANDTPIQVTTDADFTAALESICWCMP